MLGEYTVAIWIAKKTVVVHKSNRLASSHVQVVGLLTNGQLSHLRHLDKWV